MTSNKINTYLKLPSRRDEKWRYSDLKLLEIPDIKASELVKGGYLIFQDKASMYCPAQLKTMIKPGDHVIDARAGCGIVSKIFLIIWGTSNHHFL